MKLLLYEPGTAGHRLVILRYTIRCLENAGFSWQHASPDIAWTPATLVAEAVKHQCDVIYILTLDSIAGFAWKVSRLARRRGMRTICTYYLFNNLARGWKSWVWRLGLLTGGIDRIHVSDESMEGRRPAYPREVRFLPDPWDPAEFHLRSQTEARARLGLNPDAVVFLMFGAIDERKGADVFLRAAEGMRLAASPRPVVFLFAGKMTPAIRALHDQLAATAPPGYTVRAADQRIEEADVGLYYSAADYLVCAYPRFFCVSSNTVTRAFAAGRPIIVPDHWVAAMGGGTARAALAFRSGDPGSLATVLAQAVALCPQSRPGYERMADAGRTLAGERTLAKYQAWLCASLNTLK